MSRQLFGVGSNKWIIVASDEVWQIQKRWGLLSFRQLSACLYIDRRTLSKLDRHHPDGTLTLETLSHNQPNNTHHTERNFLLFHPIILYFYIYNSNHNNR